MAKIVFLMADYGHDPTETCGPYTAFKAAGFDVSFATEAGKSPQCDTKMLEGLTQRLLGASSSVVKKYRVMAESEEWKNPLSWSDEQFTLDAFDLVFLPGGHDKATKKPGKKAVGAVCHGVMVLSEAKNPDGSSVIRDCVTTALPARFEQLAFWGTRLFLGDYYKTYGAGSENVEDSVRKVLASPKQFKNSIVPSPFVVEDDNYNYVTARFPGDVELLSQKLVHSSLVGTNDEMRSPWTEDRGVAAGRGEHAEWVDHDMLVLLAFSANSGSQAWIGGVSADVGTLRWSATVARPGMSVRPFADSPSRASGVEDE
ncbi:class I glutamine amidotransferase-like protein [Trichoderma compactum]